MPTTLYTLKNHILSVITIIVISKLWYLGWLFMWQAISIKACIASSAFIIFATLLHKSLKKAYTLLYLLVADYILFMPHISILDPHIQHDLSGSFSFYYVLAIVGSTIIFPFIIHTAGKHKVSPANIIRVAFKHRTPEKTEYKTYPALILFFTSYAALLYPLFPEMQNQAIHNLRQEEISAKLKGFGECLVNSGYVFLILSVLVLLIALWQGRKSSVISNTSEAEVDAKVENKTEENNKIKATACYPAVSRPQIIEPRSFATYQTEQSAPTQASQKPTATPQPTDIKRVILYSLLIGILFLFLQQLKEIGENNYFQSGNINSVTQRY